MGAGGYIPPNIYHKTMPPNFLRVFFRRFWSFKYSLKCFRDRLSPSFEENLLRRRYATAPYCDCLGDHWSIFRPLAPKRWATEKKCFGVTCQVPRELPFGDIATAQWLTTRPVEARVCMYPFSSIADNFWDVRMGL